MFASSHHSMLRGTPLQDREGRDSEACRQATLRLLVPDGHHPGPWLLLLAGSFIYVAVQALALRLA